MVVLAKDRIIIFLPFLCMFQSFHMILACIGICVFVYVYVNVFYFEVSIKNDEVLCVLGELYIFRCCLLSFKELSFIQQCSSAY